MKDGVFIINTARGTLIDSIDLYDAIISGKVMWAALDVLEHENAIIKNDISDIRTKGKIFATFSLLDEKLLQLPNGIITPHIAYC
jgi:D-lactate dehydrogenase